MKDESTLIPIDETSITNLIYTIRGKQVMLDSDLAALYQVETKYLNRQRSRNSDRFPEDFCFQLTKEEYDFLRCQNVTSKNENGSGGRRYLPYVFTEQGIAMLSSVLKSEVAAKASINIMRAFVEMRKFLISNNEMFARLYRVELKQLETDKKLEEVFDYIATTKEVKQKIFFNGQIYDAFSRMVEIVEKAEKELILIDNYVDVNTLNILSKKKDGVNVLIVTSGNGNLTDKDVAKFNSQYPKLAVKISNDFHDRFFIIDRNEVYHIGASIKDAGKKSFGITKLDVEDLTKSLLAKVL